MKYLIIFALIIFPIFAKADLSDSYRLTIDGKRLILNEKFFFEIYRAMDDLCSILRKQVGLMRSVSTKDENGIERIERTSSASYIFNSNKMREYVNFEKKSGNKLAHDNPDEHLFANLSAHKRNWQTVALFGSLDPAIDILTVEDQQTGMYSIFKYEINRKEYKCHSRSISYDKAKK
jgi:hypothetical protein